MILDLERFANTERPRWQRLEAHLARLEADPHASLKLNELEEFHALYQHACASLAKVAPLSSEPELKRYLEWLVARAYAEIHAPAGRAPFSFRQWFLRDVPRTFRRHAGEFQLTVALTILGCLFGALAMSLDAGSRSVLLPFGHADHSPTERVEKELADRGKRLSDGKSSFSAYLMTHNIQVSLLTLALGMTFGAGTFVMLFYNGAILGAIVYDYVADGQAVFLLGWLLPHGAIEIPAILVAGQAGFILGRALIGWGSRDTRSARLRAVLPDVVTLIGLFSIMLVWAGIVEAFLSQYHEPVIPYAVKIAFGLVELTLLALFLSRAGRAAEGDAE